MYKLKTLQGRNLDVEEFGREKYVQVEDTTREKFGRRRIWMRDLCTS